MEMKEHDEARVPTVNDQAAEWFIRLRDRDVTTSDRRKFVRWLKQSPSHIAEFMRLCQLYGRVKRAKLPPLEPDDVVSNVIPLMQRKALPVDESPSGFFSLRRVRVAIAACCVALLAVIASFAISSNKIETRMSEWRKVQLADGSRVSVGPDTLLQVRYRDGTRRIRLRHGEALFDVAKDTTRPFIVDAGGAVARAVGTRFGVEARDNNVQVTVEEGRVAVVRAEQAGALENQVDLGIALALEKDERVLIAGNMPSVPLHKESVDARKELAWAQGQLILQQRTVREAVLEFNRRNRLKLVIDDPAIEDWQVCCVFDAANPEQFAKRIEAMGDHITLIREEPNILRIGHSSPWQAEPPANAPR